MNTRMTNNSGSSSDPDDLERIQQALRALPLGTKSRRMRRLWPTIETKLAEGVEHADIVATLNAHGFGLTVQTFKTLLYRHRKRSKAALATKSQGSLQPAAQGSAGASSSRQPKRPPTFNFDPRGLPPDLLK